VKKDLFDPLCALPHELDQRLACRTLLDRFACEQPCRSVWRAAHHYPLSRRALGNGASHSLAIGMASRCGSARHTGVLGAKARALGSFVAWGCPNFRSLPHPGARLAANVPTTAWPPGINYLRRQQLTLPRSRRLASINSCWPNSNRPEIFWSDSQLQFGVAADGGSRSKQKSKCCAKAIRRPTQGAHWKSRALFVGC
jgi:hypothetical protein